MVSQWIRLIECNYIEITMPMITLDSRVVPNIVRIAQILVYQINKSNQWSNGPAMCK